MCTPKNPVMPFLVLLVGALLWTSAVPAVEVSHVSNITDGLTSPTSMMVTNDGIVVLEPFSRQMVGFSSSGIVNYRVDITGEARGLCRLEGRTYLFCERAAGEVVRVNLDTGLQDLFMANAGDPVDVIVSGGLCRILDSGQGRILLCDLDGNATGTVSLAIPNDPAGAWLADLAWDQSRSIYYTWDQSNSRVLAFGEEGSFLGEFSSFGNEDGAVTRGGEIVCDQDGWIFITDRYQGQIVVFDSAWNFVINIQPVDLGGERLVVPAGLAVDPTGFVYVASTEGPAIEVFHLNKESAPLETPFTTPVSPADGDTLSGVDLRLVAGLRAPAELAAGLTVEFQVFALPDTIETVAEVSGLVLTEPLFAGGLVVGTVGWDLPRNLDVENSYLWKARGISGDQIGDWSVLRRFTKGAVLPVFRLEQNVPNPFNPRTDISFVLTGGGNAELGIFDVTGRLVWKKSLSGLEPGRHKVVWNGIDMSGATMASGVYFYRLVEAGKSDSRKMVLLR